MTKSLGDLLVVSDLDGTLLTSSEGLSGCNAAMLRLFSALGGRFTVATGRSPSSARRALWLPSTFCPGRRRWMRSAP